MTVPRIQPSQAYVQDELRRIQDNLANAVDNATSDSQLMLVDMGTFWSGGNSIVMPTTYQLMVRTIFRNGGGSVGAVMQAMINPGFAGHVVSLNGFANGALGTGNTVQMQVYCGGAPCKYPLVLNIPGPGCFTQQAPNTQTTFTAIDWLTVYIQGSSSAINQAFSASILIAKDS